MTDDKHHNHDHVDDIDCMDAIEHLYAYLDGELNDSDERAKFEKHLKHCVSCFSRKELEEELSKKIAKSGDEEVPDAVRNRVKGILDKL